MPEHSGMIQVRGNLLAFAIGLLPLSGCTQPPEAVAAHDPAPAVPSGGQVMRSARRAASHLAGL